MCNDDFPGAAGKVIPLRRLELAYAPQPWAFAMKRRADIDAKQLLVADVIEKMDCEAAVLLMPAHVSWFTAGMNVRGLIADSERPGVYTNGRQRWLLSSSVDVAKCDTSKRPADARIRDTGSVAP